MMPTEYEVLKTAATLPSLGEGKLTAMAELIQKESASSLRNESVMARIAKQCSVNVQMFIDSFQSLLTVLLVARSNFSGNLRETVDSVDPSLLPSEEYALLETFIKEISGVVSSMLDEIDASVAPNLAYDTISGMTFRIVSIAEFDKEFALNDEPATYKPAIKRLHPRAVVEFRLVDNDQKEHTVSFLANADDISRIQKFLQLGAIQLGIAADGIRQEAK